MLKQMVYVVLDDGEVVGVYDKYCEAEEVASETATITPVIVGQTDYDRVGCETPSEVIEAMRDELQHLGASTLPEDEEEEEEEEEEEDEDEDEDEEEEDDDDDDEYEDDDDDEDSIKPLIYTVHGKRVISKENADTIMNLVEALTEYIPAHKKKEVISKCFMRFCNKYQIEGIDG